MDSLATETKKLSKLKLDVSKNMALKKIQFEKQVKAETDVWDILTENMTPLTIIGWAISVLAISRGASFWFDNLVKLVNARSAGIKPKVGK